MHLRIFDVDERVLTQSRFSFFGNYQGDYIEKYPAAGQPVRRGIVRTSTGSSTRRAASSRVISGFLVVCENGLDAPVTCHRGWGNLRYNPHYQDNWTSRIGVCILSSKDSEKTHDQQGTRKI